jgi:glucose-6-phosphate 1-dehydrogenase
MNINLRQKLTKQSRTPCASFYDVYVCIAMILFPLILILLPALAAPGAFYDVVLYGASSNLAAKYLFQSLFHLSVELRGGLTVYGVGREDLGVWSPRLYSIIAANTTCGRLASVECGTARAAFARAGGSGVVAATTRDLPSLGAALNMSAARPGWAGRVVYFALASELVPGALRDLASVVDVRSGTRVVVEKPIGSDRASAAAILTALRALLSEESPPLLVDHFLAKAGVRLSASVRAALAANSPAWQAAFAKPQMTEAFAVEAEDCNGRASYFNGAGAARDMLLTHLTLVAAAALQSTGAKTLSVAARAGVLAGLRVARSVSTGRPIVTAGVYAGADSHGLERAGRVTAVGAVLESGTSRVIMATLKAAGFKSSMIRQTLSIAAEPGRNAGVAAEAAAREVCGPLTLTLHIQGELLAPSRSLAGAIRSLGLPAGLPTVLITGLCGAVMNTLGDPRVPLSRAIPDGSRARWEVREDAAAGVFAAAYDARALRIDDVIAQKSAPLSASSATSRLRAIADTAALTGGDAYTACIAAALAGVSEAFLSAAETDRLWAIWEESITDLDNAVSVGELYEYSSERPPPWFNPYEVGQTMKSHEVEGESHHRGDL